MHCLCQKHGTKRQKIYIYTAIDILKQSVGECCNIYKCADSINFLCELAVSSRSCNWSNSKENEEKTKHAKECKKQKARRRRRKVKIQKRQSATASDPLHLVVKWKIQLVKSQESCTSQRAVVHTAWQQICKYLSVFVSMQCSAEAKLKKCNKLLNRVCAFFLLPLICPQPVF